MKNTFILKFTQGSLDKILKELNKDSITKQEFYKELQDNLNNSTIYGIYDYDVAELENIGKNTRQEVRIILKEYNIALCIKPKSYNTLEIFRSLDKDFTHIKNIESAKMLPYKFKVADEYIQGYLRAKELITKLKTDFEIRLKEAKKKNKEIAEFIQNKIDITQAINKKDKKEMQKMQDKLKENTILFTNDIAKMIRYAFNYAKKAIYIQSPWIKYNAINALKKELETSLQNDVKIYIQCGIKDARDETKSDIIDEDSKRYIDSLKEKFSKNFRISINNNDHSKIFIFDNNDVEWLMIGSYNFLSFYPSNNIDDMDRGETIMLTNNKNAIKICKDKILKACEND